MEEERPVNRIVDCGTNEHVDVPLSDEEWEEHKKRSAEHEKKMADEAAQREKRKQAALAHPDPLVKEMARELGWI